MRHLLLATVAASLLSSCESDTRFDCPALAQEACLANRPTCLWAGLKNSGDCLNTCELEEPDCEEGLTCKDVPYYDPDQVEQVVPYAPACSPE